jgi:predicted kinase
MQTLYILCGLPFTGKSILGKEMAIKTGYTLISYDDVWQSLSHLNKNITYKIVLDDCKKQITDLLNEGFSVIYDSTNPKEEYRLEFKNLAKASGVNSQVVYLELSLDEINQRREKSLIDKTHHVVSDENFNNAVAQLETPVDAIVLKKESDVKDFLNSFTRVGN